MARSGVYVVLSTFNGAAYLAELVESIQRQSFHDWRLLVRDDGSSDATVDILERFAREDPRISLLRPDGKNLGAPASFGALLLAARDCGARYVFLADQDDVWLEGKLARLLAAMSDAEADAGADTPVLVYSDLMVVGSDLRLIHPSFRRQLRLQLPPPPALLPALLTQNFVTGCASLLNRPLLEVVVPVPDSMAMHDWWVAQCAAAMGTIVDVGVPTILYRQHADNVLGAKRGMELVWRALRSPWRWWVRGWRNFLLGVRQAEVLARRLAERPIGSGSGAHQVVARYCAVFGPSMTPPQRLRAVRYLGALPVGRVPRLLYYTRVLLYRPPRSASSTGS